MSAHYHWQNIRLLLSEGLTVQELRRFCATAPAFQREFPDHTAKQTIIRYLIKRAEDISQGESLLIWAKTHNPVRYRLHAPYYVTRQSSSLWPRPTFRFKPAQMFRRQVGQSVWIGLYLTGTLAILGIGFGLVAALFH